MKELNQGLGLILSRIAGFLHILDLSFLVAGAVSLAAVAYLIDAVGLDAAFVADGWLRVLFLLVAVYATGIAAFAAGRWGRQRLQWLKLCFSERGPGADAGGHWARFLPHCPTLRLSEREQDAAFEKDFLPILRAHGLDQDPRFAPYLDPGRTQDRGPWRVYTRLWAELRHDRSRLASLSLVHRYWVMSATCDGLAAACVLWALVLAGLWSVGIELVVAAGGKVPASPWLVWSLVLALIGVAALLGRESARYLHYQQEELVASLAATAPAPGLEVGDGLVEGDGG